MRTISAYQTLISVVALAGITVLGYTDQISSDALIAVYSAVLGGALGYVNGKKSASQ